MTFDMESFRLPTVTQQAVRMTAEPATDAKPRMMTQRFIKGPIPVSWLRKANSLPGHTALPLGLCLWHQAGLERSKADLRLTTKLKGQFELKDRSVTDALKALEKAELVSVQRPPGRCAIVTILEVLDGNP